MKKEFDGAMILKKNKDYNSVQEAEVFYERKRLTELATTLFPVEEYPEGFKENLIKLMKFQNPVQMNVWHVKNKGIINKETGERIITTWETMCTFGRPFQCAEMYQCLEILKRATPVELNDLDLGSRCEDNWILNYFNETKYPEIEKICNQTLKALNEIEEQIMEPIRAEINANLKVMMQMPVGKDVEFIKKRTL